MRSARRTSDAWLVGASSVKSHFAGIISPALVASAESPRNNTPSTSHAALPAVWPGTANTSAVRSPMGTVAPSWAGFVTRRPSVFGGTHRVIGPAAAARPSTRGTSGPAGPRLPPPVPPAPPSPLVPTHASASFGEELDRQAARVVVPSSIFAALVWLPFIVSDRALHPEVTALPYLRVGLTVVAVLAIVTHVFFRARVRPQNRLLAVMAYMQAASATAAALSGADPAYIGGYLVVLMVLPAIPLSRGRALASFTLSIVTFAAVAFLADTPLGDPARRYSLTNAVAVLLGVPFLVLVLEQVRRKSWRMAMQIEAQRVELAADKARIDQLLHNILPAPIVTELKANDRVEPRHHADVTVLFTDFVGFSSVAEQVTAEELVADLDSCFTLFDTIAARRGLERLKTIGDSYMAAAGVPVARRTHAADAVLAGLDIARAIAARSAARRAGGRPGWDVRVGIHTGPLVAGVVGQTRFAYDVWGDTVNLASRMESSGAPGRVNVSEGTAGRVAELFVL